MDSHHEHEQHDHDQAHGTGEGEGGQVVDLNAVRARNAVPTAGGARVGMVKTVTPDGRTVSAPDTVPGVGAVTAGLAGVPVQGVRPDTIVVPGPDTAGAVSDGVPGREVAERTADVDGRPDGSDEPLDGVVVTASVLDLGPPEAKSWAWAVGWRHKARRLWTYRYLYVRNTIVVLGAWALRAVGWWFRGLGRSVRDFFAYVDDRQGLAVANQTAGGLDGRADVDAWLKTRAERHREVRDRRRVVRTRLALPLLTLIALVIAAAVAGRSEAVRAAITPALAVGWAGVGCWLVYYGRARTAPFWPTFREPSPYPPVSNDTVTGALLATGISQFKELIRGGQSPIDVIYRDDAAGGKVAETHPVPGVTTEMVMAKATIIAGAMKRPPAMVHLSQAPSGVPGHVEILFLDIDPGTQKPRRFAYLGKPVNVGAPCTIGYDPRNRPIRWVLPGGNGITTGTPGSGKTAYLIGLGCLAGADADGAQLAIFDFKGMGDYSELEPVCYAYGADSDTTETARLLVGALRALKRDVVRRRKVLTELKKAGSDLLDHNAAAVTDRLARTTRYGLAWVLFIIDEVHEALADPIHGEEIAALLMDLMKIGRACGIHFEIASQRTDATSIPSGISSLPIIRVAFHQNGQLGNDQILGTGAYKRGIDATAFRRGVAGSVADDRGSCWYIGSEGGEPVRVRTTFVLPDVKRIITAALEARTKAGTLTGAAAGITEQLDTGPVLSALDDVRAVFIGDDDALHGDVIFHRVNTRHPGRWKSQTALMAALRAEAPQWKSPTRDVSRVRPKDAPEDAGIERTRKGIRLEELTAAIAHRTTTTG
jgi:S-DNA-T family DNA segregation ATPase FtsK/SpoIIIE